MSAMREGIALYNRGEFAGAARHFRRLASGGDDRPEACLFLAYSLKSLNRHAEAASCLKALARRRPDYGPAARGVAEMQLKAGRLRSAAAWLKRALRNDPKDPQSLRLAADIDLLRGAGRRKARGPGGRRAVERGPSRSGRLVLLTSRAEELERKAHRAAREGRLAQAQAFARRALALEQAKLAHWEDPGQSFRALVRLGRFQDACDLAERILDEGASRDQLKAFWNPWGWLPRALVPKRRQARLARLARARPFAAYLLAALNEGESDIEALLRLPPSRYGWMAGWLGQRLLSLGMPSKARRILQAGVDRDPSDWTLRMRLAEALLCLGREEEALDQAAAFPRAAPKKERASASAWKGEIELWAGRYSRALKALETSCRMGEPLAWCWRGAAAVQLGRLKKGLRFLDKGLRLLPHDSEALIWRGEANRRLGRLEEALEDLSHPPIGFWARVNRGLIMAAKGETKAVEREFRLIQPCSALDYARGTLRIKSASPATMPRILQGALALARGYRREDYRQLVWARPTEA